jgi:two-component system, NtrC family, response regulator AtoC
MKELYALVKRVAVSTVSVLILGETGVGKELLARAIHDNSSRRESRLVTLNCAAIPENLVESELFGFERGAFSGAVAPKPGLFEAADKSTLFLDEVGELPKAVQAKLLRVLETGEVSRLGSIRTVRVDVRIVAATNRDISSEISTGAFRADLFYRLNGMTVKIPSLRERQDDIAALAEHFASHVSRDGASVLTQETLAALKGYPWPGNVRELRSVVERAVLLAQGGPIEPKHLLFDPPSAKRSRRPPKNSAASSLSTAPPAEDEATFSHEERTTGAVAAELKAELAMREQRRIRTALERAGGNQTDAAKLLGISRRTLINRIEQYGIARPRKRRDTSHDA